MLQDNRREANKNCLFLYLIIVLHICEEKRDLLVFLVVHFIDLLFADGV